MNLTDLELVLTTVLSCMALYVAYRGLALKIGGMKVRGRYVRCSSIACEDQYVSLLTLENVRDRAVTIFAVYLRFGHNIYLEIDDFGDKPMVLEPFGTFQKEYGPLEFYSAGTKRIKLDELFSDKKVKKRLVLSTSDGKYTVRHFMPVWNPIGDFFRNYMTVVALPIRSVYKGKAYGSNAIYLVELHFGDNESQVIPLYPRDHDIRRFRRFSLTPQSLESREALQSFIEAQRENGNLTVESVVVHDLRAAREDRFDSWEKEIVEGEGLGFLRYHLVGWVLTRIDEWETRRQNKKLSKLRQKEDGQACSDGPQGPPPKDVSS